MNALLESNPQRTPCEVWCKMMRDLHEQEGTEKFEINTFAPAAAHVLPPANSILFSYSPKLPAAPDLCVASVAPVIVSVLRQGFGA